MWQDIKKMVWCCYTDIDNDGALCQSAWQPQYGRAENFLALREAHCQSQKTGVKGGENTGHQDKMVSLWHVKANVGMVSMECCEDTRNTAMG